MNIKPTLLAAAFSISLVNSVVHAQNYTWQTGSGTLNTPGLYGTPGVPAPNNHPGGREPAGWWTDAAGNFWTFGGHTFLQNNNCRNDLWKYTPSINQWTFMKGDSTILQAGNYGVVTVPSPFNKPRSRTQSVSWTDAAGNFWLFGGSCYTGSASELYNDLWKYEPATNTWTWMKGSSQADAPGVYGGLGVPGNANVPGARTGAIGWTDASGNLWLFGGTGIDINSSYGQRNDLWRYTIATNQWTWMSGSGAFGQAGIYGSQGVSAASNMPGARVLPSGFADTQGNLWMFGGNIGGNSLFNDLWRYTIATNEWTWMKGTNTVSQAGIYGTQGVPSANTMPGGRFRASSWSDAGGNNFFIYGGAGYGSSNIGMDFLDDLWQYNVASNQWTWLRGIGSFTQAAVFGTQGVTAPTNKPGGMMHCATWRDAANNLWLFGGNGYGSAISPTGFQNNLWRFGSCILEYPTISSSSQVLCSGNTVTLTASGASSYSWSTAQTGTTISVAPQATTIYTVVSTAANACNLPSSVTVSVAALPSVTAVTSNSLACVNTSVTLSAGGAVSYSWQSGQATQNITVEATNTVYVVTGTDANGCMKTVTVTQAAGECTGINEYSGATHHLSIVPNPSRGHFSVVTSSQAQLTSVTIVNSLGQVQLKLINVAVNETISTGLPEGLYYIYAEDATQRKYVAKMTID